MIIFIIILKLFLKRNCIDSKICYYELIPKQTSLSIRERDKLFGVDTKVSDKCFS